MSAARAASGHECPRQGSASPAGPSHRGVRAVRWPGAHEYSTCIQIHTIHLIMLQLVRLASASYHAWRVPSSRDFLALDAVTACCCVTAGLWPLRRSQAWRSPVNQSPIRHPWDRDRIRRSLFGRSLTSTQWMLDWRQNLVSNFNSVRAWLPALIF
jgi:hypothetical protein